MSFLHVQRLLSLSGRRDGIVHLAELAEAGVDRHAAARLREAGVVSEVAPGVLRVAGSPPTWRQMVWIALAVGGADAVVSHRTAAVLWGLVELTSGTQVEVTIPRWNGQDHHEFLVHRSTDLTADQVRTIGGMPVTAVDRTLIDLAGVTDAETLETAYDAALRRRLTTPEAARSTLHQLGRRGRRGTAGLRALLAARTDIEGVTESRFEVRLLRIIRRFELPEPVRQYTLRDSVGVIGRFDAAYPEARVAIEADSEAWHMDQRRFIADRTRRNRAEALGWRVSCFTWHHVTREPELVADTIDRTLIAAGWDWRAAS